jgi:hypothetical protein
MVRGRAGRSKPIRTRPLQQGKRQAHTRRLARPGAGAASWW